MRKYRIQEHIDNKGETRTDRKLIRDSIRERCNISANTLSRWEQLRMNDKGDIPANQLLLVSQVLDVDVSELFTPLPVTTVAASQ